MVDFPQRIARKEARQTFRNRQTFSAAITNFCFSVRFETVRNSFPQLTVLIVKIDMVKWAI